MHWHLEFPQLNDPAWLRVQIAVGRSLRSLATEIGCDRHNLPLWLHRHGIKVPPPPMPRLQRIAALVAPAEPVEAEAQAEADAARLKTAAQRVRADDN